MKNILTDKISKRNFITFLWHSFFFSLASNFMDIHTVIPSMLIKAGGSAILLGLLTSIMMGGSHLAQIIFAGFLSDKKYKKNSLLLAINLRIVSLFLLSVILFKSDSIDNIYLIILIFIVISIFSFSGSYANISYVDVLGKSILNEKRKRFFSIKEIFNSLGFFISAVFVSIFLKQFSYPDNYGVLFLIAGMLLFIASLGFWRIKEVATKVQYKNSFKEYLKKIPGEIASNSNLKNYLLVINNLGLGHTFIPFMVLFAKSNFDLSYNLIGKFLICKIIGMLIIGLIIYRKSHKFEYKQLLYFSLILGASLPVLSLIFRDNLFIYQFLFILSGVFITTYKITSNGVLMEISNNENRATYAGIAGAGNILPAVFPLIAGILISVLGYTITFIILSLVISSSIFFIRKLNCRKVNLETTVVVV